MQGPTGRDALNMDGLVARTPPSLRSPLLVLVMFACYGGAALLQVGVEAEQLAALSTHGTTQLLPSNPAAPPNPAPACIARPALALHMH